MYARACAVRPRGVRLKHPEDVAAAVVSSIERDRAEIDVADISMRVAGVLGGVFPRVVATSARWSGARAIRHQMMQ
jgi:hypothetical protein